MGKSASTTRNPMFRQNDTLAVRITGFANEVDSSMNKFDLENPAQKEAIQGEEWVPGAQARVFLAIAVMAAIALPLIQLVSLFVVFQVFTGLVSLGAFVLIIPSVSFFVVQLHRKGLISDASKTLMWFWVALNCGLLLLFVIGILGPMWMLATGESLVIMGGLTSSSLKMNVYAHGMNSFQVSYMRLGSGTDLVTNPVSFQDSTGMVEITGLEPATEYTYSVTLFDGDSDEEAGPTGSFRTLPEDSGKIVFASTSCAQKGRVVGDVELDGFTHMANSGDLDFLIFLGDTIYTDLPWGIAEGGSLAYGTDEKLYKADYRRTFADKHMNAFLKETPVFSMYDDHEITNDVTSGNGTEMFQVAVEAWDQYIGLLNPPQAAAASSGGHQYSFQAGVHDFFVLDTLHWRDNELGLMIGKDQLAQVQQWLLDTQATRSGFKFLSAPVGWSRNADEPDWGWNCGCPRCEKMTLENEDSCPNERDAITKFIVDNNITGVVLVSGDTHKPGVFELEPGLIEVSASPIHALSYAKFKGKEDPTLFEAEFTTTAYAIYTVEDTRLTVDIYGGGIDINTSGYGIIVGFLTFAYLFAWIIFSCWGEAERTDRKSRYHNTPFGEHVVVAGSLVLLGLVLTGVFSYWVSKPYLAKDFEEPLYTFSIDL